MDILSGSNTFDKFLRKLPVVIMEQANIVIANPAMVVIGIVMQLFDQFMLINGC